MTFFFQERAKHDTWIRTDFRGAAGLSVTSSRVRRWRRLNGIIGDVLRRAEFFDAIQGCRTVKCICISFLEIMLDVWRSTRCRGSCTRCAAAAVLWLLQVGIAGSDPARWGSSTTLEQGSNLGSAARLGSRTKGAPSVGALQDDGTSADASKSDAAAQESKHSRRLLEMQTVGQATKSPVVAELKPKRGSVFGSTLITVRGTDFVGTGDYSLQFSSATFKKSATQWIYRDSETLEFISPIWGDSLDSFYGAVRTDVKLLFNGEQVSKLNTTDPLYFLYEPRWWPESFGPVTTGSVLGGTNVTVEGHGFNPNDVFFCHFSVTRAYELLHWVQVRAYPVFQISHGLSSKATAPVVGGGHAAGW